MAGTLKYEIEAQNQKFMDAFARQDANGIGALYTEDCKIMPPEVDVLMGKENVAKVFSSVMKSGAAKVKLEVDEVGFMEGGNAFERSHFTFTKADGSTLSSGKYVVIWKKIDSKYMMYIDIFNSVIPQQ